MFVLRTKLKHSLIRGVLMLAGIIATIGVSLHVLSLRKQAVLFEGVAENTSVRGLRRDISSDVAAAKEFVQTFLRGYRATLDEKVPLQSQAHFFLSGRTNFSGRLLLTESRMACSYFTIRTPIDLSCNGAQSGAC